MEKAQNLIEKLNKEIHLADYVDSDYCDGVEKQLLSNTVELLELLYHEKQMLQDIIKNIDKAILEEQEHSKKYFGYNFVMNIRRKFNEIIGGRIHE